MCRVIVSRLISGTLLAQHFFVEAKHFIQQTVASGHRPPLLAMILVGDNEASKVYINHKKRVCDQIGILSFDHFLDKQTTQHQLIALVHDLNVDNDVDGILMQLPLPEHIDARAVIDAIDYTKDVDGLHRYNFGSLVINSASIYPCTALGIIRILDSIEFAYCGQRATVIGTSLLVGKPIALELINRGMTVTVCNSKTTDLVSSTSNADLLIVATGHAHLIGSDHVKHGAVVIDVGISRMSDGSLMGDVDLDAVYRQVSHITPVPGGVGPMTIASLMDNTLTLYKQHIDLTS
jgi:methylenetetrahydrofolate dehydrogenase (NADP+) / methenyltetrahydrofolate cyclohydrolase